MSKEITTDILNKINQIKRDKAEKNAQYNRNAEKNDNLLEFNISRGGLAEYKKDNKPINNNDNNFNQFINNKQSSNLNNVNNVNNVNTNNNNKPALDELLKEAKSNFLIQNLKFKIHHLIKIFKNQIL